MSGATLLISCLNLMAALLSCRAVCQIPRADAALCTVECPKHGFIDEPLVCRLQCIDQLGNHYAGGTEVIPAQRRHCYFFPVQGVGGAAPYNIALATQVAAHVNDGDQFLFTAHVADCGDGKFDLSFIPTVAAVYSLVVTVDGREVRDSPLLCALV